MEGGASRDLDGSASRRYDVRMWVFDRSWQHTIAILAMAVNVYLLRWVWGSAVDRDDQGNFCLVAQVGPGFYLLSATLLVSCLGSAWLIRYQSVDLRWGARILFCLLPALASLYLMAALLGLLG